MRGLQPAGRRQLARLRTQKQEEQGLEKMKIYCHKDIFPPKYWKDFNIASSPQAAALPDERAAACGEEATCKAPYTETGGAGTGKDENLLP